MARDRVYRFNVTERAVHWTFSLLFLALLATGLILSVPSWSAAVGRRATVRAAHIVMGLALVGVPGLIALAGNRRSIAQDARAIDRFDAEDGRFLLQHPSRPGRFNAGQKLNAIASLSAALLLLATGVIMWRWPSFPRDWRQGAIAVHQWATLVMVPVVAGHIWLAAVHRSTRPSLRGILTGWVDLEWARRAYPRWEAVADEERSQ